MLLLWCVMIRVRINVGLVYIKRFVVCLYILAMARIVHVHHVDKDSFLKGNIDPDPDEVDLVFERSPNYAGVDMVSACALPLH
jgi:hypothetical protein